jgi:hypothetical protein
MDPGCPLTRGLSWPHWLFDRRIASRRCESAGTGDARLRIVVGFTEYRRRNESRAIKACAFRLFGPGTVDFPLQTFHPVGRSGRQHGVINSYFHTPYSVHTSTFKKGKECSVSSYLRLPNFTSWPNSPADYLASIATLVTSSIHVSIRAG